MQIGALFADVDEEQLARPPIVRAVAQLQFGPVLMIPRPDFVAPLQESLRRTYPQAGVERAVNFVIGPDGVSQQGGDSIWRFADGDGWSVTLSPTFIALDTTSYSNRSDFVARLRFALLALVDLVGQETPWTRLGVRYVNRLDGEDFDMLERFVEPHALGARAVPTPADVSLVHSLSEAQFALGSSSGLVLRWGVLPAGVSVTPDVPAAATPAWVLDADAFSTTGGARIDIDALAGQCQSLCETTYRAFRWAVTNELLESRRDS